jgi:transcriptional regulator with XRE-family HTH domain
MDTDSPTFGALLRTWRRRRRISQLELACEAGISQRHVSFVESGRSAPSRDMVLRLAEQLDVPLRDRNAMLVAAGFAPLYRDRSLESPGLEQARRAVTALLEAHAPNPALAVDRHWQLVAANRTIALLLDGIDPVNVIRVSLHPRGLAPRIGNIRQWRAHVIARLMRQVDVSGDAVLAALLEEVKGFPVPASALPHRAPAADPLAGIAVPLVIEVGGVRLAFLSATTIFGTAVDITLSELAIESFLPADAATAEALVGLAGA